MQLVQTKATMRWITKTQMFIPWPYLKHPHEHYICGAFLKCKHVSMLMSLYIKVPLGLYADQQEGSQACKQLDLLVLNIFPKLRQSF